MKREMKAIVAILVLALLTAGVCAQQQPISFINVVGVGDSLTAGFQSGVLKESNQRTAFPVLITQQLRTYFFLPLVTGPGFGQEIRLVSGQPVVGSPTTGSPGAPRVFPLLIPQNLAIPGQDVAEALGVRPNLPIDTLEDVILGIPSLVAPLGIPPLSQIELAVGMNPTFTFFWLGSNDVLGAALGGDATLATPIPAFQQAYTMALGALVTLTKSRVIVANIPDVTVLAYLTPAEAIAAQVGAPLAAIGPALGIGAGDLVTAPGIPLVSAILGGQRMGPLPANTVLTAAEVATLKTHVAQMNGFIAAIGAQLNVPVVDINSILNDIHKNGTRVGNFRLTTGFLGGLFSLDGFHPTNTGQGLIANAFIERMNAFYGLNVPLVNVAAIAAADPLVPKTPTGEPPAIMAMTETTARNLTALFAPSAESRQFEEVKGAPRGEAVSFEWLLPRVQSYLDQFPVYSLDPGPVWGNLSISIRDACVQPGGVQLLERRGN